MASVTQNQIEVPENLRKQLAFAVRSIQWSYAIFWSLSTAQSGMLEWCDGYYNGEIKTRKTVQSVESNADQLGLQRSDQLRELYDSLSVGETNHLAKRPTAALIPEDLCNTEWYFLVCMSFKFEIGQELPGKTLAKNGAIWLCNAHRAQTKVFSRALLAKSASIQTIVCFPHLGGVVELGTTKLVQEDGNLIHHVKANFLEGVCATLVQNPSDEHLVQDNVAGADDTNMDDIHSTSNCSDEFADNLLREDSNLIDGLEVETPLNWQFMGDSISNYLNNSLNSSDCVSQTHGDPETVFPNMEPDPNPHPHPHPHGECNHNNSIGLKQTDKHYQTVLSNLLKSSHHFILGPYFRNRNRESSFLSWVKVGATQVHRTAPSQSLLKKVLFEVPRLHQTCGSGTIKESCNSRPEVDENDKNHVLSERKRREKINERFLILGSLIPSGGKVDKVSILDYTIDYLRDLESKVEELEAYKEAMEQQSSTDRKPQDTVERTSDNYGSDKKKLYLTKRKLCETDKTGSRNSRTRLRDTVTDNISVQVLDKDVLIETRCSWRENMTVQVMGAVGKLRLDIHTIGSSNVHGILSITIKAKCKGLKAPSASVIKQALQNVISQELKKQNGV